MHMGGGGGGLGKSRSLNSTVVDQKQTGKEKILVLRRMGKYLRIEALAQWMQGLLPQYGVEVV